MKAGKRRHVLQTAAPIPVRRIHCIDRNYVKVV
jgi:hypothetical protein